MAKRAGSISSISKKKGPRKTKKRLEIKKARKAAAAPSKRFKKK